MSTVILIVDDSASFRGLLAAIVRHHFPEWVVLEATDALAALKKVRENEVDLITLDVEMPGVDGLFLAPDLKEYAPRARVAIISGSSRPDIEKQAASMDIEVIRKPLVEEEFLHFLAPP